MNGLIYEEMIVCNYNNIKRKYYNKLNLLV